MGESVEEYRNKGVAREYTTRAMVGISKLFLGDRVIVDARYVLV